ncbi:restriction endonuclease [Candidatus Filomicrobium marinum]|uniref:restriction endonuclease n=1 Tax=Candidatus Filomicrobium marinum TaxID=1608628 RepID=UPI00329824BF
MEGKQRASGRKSGTDWEIDAKGIREGNRAIVLVECRRYKRRLNQEALAAVAYRIDDIGTDGGITVSPFPLQQGAAKVAAASRIEHVQLRPDSTREQWIAQIGEFVHVGLAAATRATVSLEIEVRDRHGNMIERRRS